MNRWLLAVIAVLAALAAQQPPSPPDAPKPAAPKPDSGVFRLPSQFPEEAEASKPKEPEAPPKVVLTNEGKPLLLPVSCGDEDIQSFGMTCTQEDPCPVFLELAHVHGDGSRIVVAGNLHNGSTTMYSVLLASFDGGRTFEEPFERVRNGGLDQIQFFDAATGWISGQLLLSVPRDPFLLLTTDGGKSWRRRPVFSESRIGSIEQFVFESKTAGAMLVDRQQSGEGGRYERYETMTGGDSWTIREVSPRPARLKGVREGAAPDWRLQPDAKTKTNTVENRTGERWRRIAAFQVHVAECRPSHKELEPPPQPSAEEQQAAERPGPVVTPRRGAGAPPTLRKKP